MWNGTAHAHTLTHKTNNIYIMLLSSNVYLRIFLTYSYNQCWDIIIIIQWTVWKVNILSQCYLCIFAHPDRVRLSLPACRETLPFLQQVLPNHSEFLLFLSFSRTRCCGVRLLVFDANTNQPPLRTVVYNVYSQLHAHVRVLSKLLTALVVGTRPAS